MPAVSSKPNPPLQKNSKDTTWDKGTSPDAAPHLAHKENTFHA